MDKWKIKGKESPKADSLLPPTRRFPNATPERKKEKKWSIGGFFKRISSTRDSESSSAEEDTSAPKNRTSSRRKAKSSASRSNPFFDRIVLHPLPKAEAENPAESTSDLRSANSQESLQVSRSSDGSLDGSNRRHRRGKAKARVEAERGKLCGESSSEEDSHKSSSSLAPSQRKSDACSRRTRNARTERYIKRLSREDCVGASNGNPKKNGSLSECSESNNDAALQMSRPPAHPRFLVPQAKSRPSVNQPQKSNALSSPVADPPPLLQPNGDAAVISGRLQLTGEFSRSQKAKPPEPPPRDPQRRVLSLGSGDGSRPNSYAFDGRLRGGQIKFSGAVSNSGDETAWFEALSSQRSRPSSVSATTPRGTLVSRGNESLPSPFNHSDEDNGRRQPWASHRKRLLADRPRNCSSESESSSRIRGPAPVSPMKCGPQIFQTVHKNEFPVPLSDFMGESASGCLPSPPPEPPIRRRSQTNSAPTLDGEASTRKRSSKNLEDALSELEAIYNSLRLGDEDLLERAERRSMEEFDRGGKRSEAGADRRADERRSDVPDRIKDDMAYRRMNPKERPSSLDGQASLSKISYLFVSPILARRSVDRVEPKLRGCCNEPDVTRDDVVFRSISHANNKLRVVEPQPPFGIPLGPVTSATDSDYLHATPTRPDNPRSLYIPKSEPNVITDDLAFRNLRKDSSRETPVMDAGGDGRGIREAVPPPRNDTGFGMRKKAAVRSLSANLYGLINREAVFSNDEHARRNPIFRGAIRDADSRFGAKYDASEDCKGKLKNGRHVVSDTESSSPRTHRYNFTCSSADSDVDVNGNRPNSAFQRKLQVFVPKGEKRRESQTRIDLESTKRTSSAFAGRKDDGNSGSRTSEPFSESEISRYKQLCQDLENLVRLAKGNGAEEDKRRETASKEPIVKILPDPSSPVGTFESKNGPEERSRWKTKNDESEERRAKDEADSDDKPERSSERTFTVEMRAQILDEEPKSRMDNERSSSGTCEEIASILDKGFDNNARRAKRSETRESDETRNKALHDPTSPRENFERRGEATAAMEEGSCLNAENGDSERSAENERSSSGTCDEIAAILKKDCESFDGPSKANEMNGESHDKDSVSSMERIFSNLNSPAKDCELPRDATAALDDGDSETNDDTQDETSERWRVKCSYDETFTVDVEPKVPSSSRDNGRSSSSTCDEIAAILEKDCESFDGPSKANEMNGESHGKGSVSSMERILSNPNSPAKDCELPRDAAAALKDRDWETNDHAQDETSERWRVKCSYDKTFTVGAEPKVPSSLRDNRRSSSDACDEIAAMLKKDCESFDGLSKANKMNGESHDKDYVSSMERIFSNLNSPAKDCELLRDATAALEDGDSETNDDAQDETSERWRVKCSYDETFTVDVEPKVPSSSRDNGRSSSDACDEIVAILEKDCESFNRLSTSNEMNGESHDKDSVSSMKRIFSNLNSPAKDCELPRYATAALEDGNSETNDDAQDETSERWRVKCSYVETFTVDAEPKVPPSSRDNGRSSSDACDEIAAILNDMRNECQTEFNSEGRTATGKEDKDYANVAMSSEKKDVEAGDCGGGTEAVRESWNSRAASETQQLRRSAIQSGSRREEGAFCCLEENSGGADDGEKSEASKLEDDSLKTAACEGENVACEFDSAAPELSLDTFARRNVAFLSDRGMGYFAASFACLLALLLAVLAAL